MHRNNQNLPVYPNDVISEKSMNNYVKHEMIGSNEKLT